MQTQWIHTKNAVLLELETQGSESAFLLEFMFEKTFGTNSDFFVFSFCPVIRVSSPICGTPAPPAAAE